MPKRIDIKKFQEFGYLQEANRLFFHPLGLALEVITDVNGKVRLGGVWDALDDPEGILFDHFNIEKMTRVSAVSVIRRLARIDLPECNSMGIQVRQLHKDKPQAVITELDEKERKVQGLLVDAWEAFRNLEKMHPDEEDEFRHAIHDAERIIMVRRVAGE